MTSVKYFHSELPGAPVLSGTAGSLVAVLDACLVNGWGLLTATAASVTAEVCTITFATGHSFEPLSVALVAGAGTAAINGEKRITSTATNTISFAAPGVADGPVTGTITVKLAPAGWVKAFSGTNKAAYKSAAVDASGCVARIDDSAAQFARLRAFETMTDVDTGVGPTPTDAQQAGGLYLAKSNTANTTARRWIVAANDRLVYLMVANYSAFQNDYASYAFGDFKSLKAGDAYNFIVVGDVSDMSNSSTMGTNNALNSWASSSGAYIVRNYTQTGGALQGALTKPGQQSTWSGSSSGHPAGPNPINNAIELCPALIYEGGSQVGANRRGHLPGYYGIPYSLGDSYDSKSTINAQLGLSGHTLIAVRYYGATSAASSCRFALDVTGPWD